MEKKSKEKKQNEKSKKKDAVRTENKILTRGMVFEGYVTKKFPKRITIEFDRTVFIPKFERFMKKKTRIHAHLPIELDTAINIGDLVQVQECRPLSNMIHFLVTKKIKSTEEKGDRA